jgi:hypothetical protein
MRAWIGPLFLLLANGCIADEKVNPLPGAASSSASTGSGGVGGQGGQGGSTPKVPPLLDGASCDPLVPTECGFPFPSNVYLIDDASTKSGKRVAFGEETLPIHHKSASVMSHIPAAIVADSDGFSPGQAPMTDMPGASITGLPTQDDIALSITTDSPTILLDADTGELVPHFAELDMNGDVGDRALMIRPVVRLHDAHRYIVAIRDVLDDNGVPLLPSPVFEALRDDLPSAEPSVDLRRSLYADIFGKLAAAGIPKDNLQIAWDYSTATRENNTAKMVAMRDAALAAIPANGPPYVIDTVTPDPNSEIALRLEGHFTVPLYLTNPDPGGALVVGPDGLPMQNGTASYSFIVQIPHSATTGTPGAILQNAHGLLGSLNEGRDGYLATIANRGNFVTIAVDMIGMASDDEATAVKAILEDPMQFRPFVERQLQGMTNELLAMRMMMGAFAQDPQVMFNGVSAIDTTHRYYRGDSQGGIFGGTYMALSTDVTRGLLGEPGAPYNLLLNRSVDFQTFYNLLVTRYASKRDTQIVLGIIQMLWDRIEPDGYLPYIAGGELGAPPHQVLIHDAFGDHQVTPLGAHLVARAVGAKALTPAARPIWGIDEAAGPFTGSGIVEYDYGALVPPLPTTNTPTSAPDDTDPHDWVRKEATAMDQSAHFFLTGEVAGYCTGTCDPN